MKTSFLNLLRMGSPADATMARVLIAAVLVAIAAEFLFRQYGFSGPYWTFLSQDYFVQSALLSIAVIHGCAVKDWREILAVAAMAVLAYFILELLDLRFIRGFRQQFAYAAALGTGSVQLVRLVQNSAVPAELLKRMRLARDSLIFVVAGALPTSFMVLSSVVNPTLDHLVAQFDDAYGIRIISITWWLVESAPWFKSFLAAVYLSTPVGIAVVFALQRRAIPPVPLTIGLSAVAGFTLYFFLPVVGPQKVFPEFLTSFWPVADFDKSVAPVMPTGFPRNCMPSLHSAWVYILVFSSYGLARPIRFIVAIYALLTLVSAIHIGEHWFTDLVVALPFALAVQALACISLPLNTTERFEAIAVGIAFTCMQLVLMFAQPLVFPGSTIFYWAILIGTVCHVFFFWGRLARRLEGVTSADTTLVTAGPGLGHQPREQP